MDNTENNKQLLKLAFEAGEAFNNKCFCGECDYCLLFEADEKSPDFETWYNLNKINGSIR